MKYLIASIFVFSSALAILRGGDEKTDLDLMQGIWLVASLTEEGTAVPAAEIDILEVTIEKNVVTVREKGKIVVQYSIKIDAKKTPKEIDFTFLVGDDKGKTEPGIYAFEKDQFKLCMDEKKKGRPTAFAGKEAATCSVMVLKKKAKAEDK